MTATMIEQSRRHETTTRLWAANPGARRAYLLVTAAALAEGLALLLVDPTRTSGPAYRVINDSVGPRVLAVVLLVLVALLAAAPLLTPAAVRAALVAGCAVHGLAAWSFLSSAIVEPFAGPLAPIYATAVAAWFVSQSELYRIPRTPKR